MGKKKRNLGFTANQWRVAEKLGFTTELMQKIDKGYELKGYPKSMEFAYGYTHYLKHEHDKAIASFIIGAKNVGCVGCMFFYAFLQKERGNVYLAVTFYFEASIRGHVLSMGEMVACYNYTKPKMAKAFQNFWTKIIIELGDTFYSKEKRLAYKKKDQSMCANCGKEVDYEDMTSKKLCGGCRYYSFCGKDCQRQNWKTLEDGGQNHMGECRQLKILKHHYRRNAKDIREAIICGENPKDIVRLQTLRTLLGLNRPKEEYKELLVTLGELGEDDKNDLTKCQKRYEYLTARKNGTVWIGSTPNMI